MKVTGAALIILLVLILGFTLYVPRTEEAEEGGRAFLTEESPTFPAIRFEDNYRRGSHTIAGTILLPTPCTQLTAEAVRTEEVISVQLTTTEDAGVCLRVPEERKFSVTAEAPEEVVVDIFVNGALALTTRP